MNLTATRSEFTFKPVVINRGRKFRGKAYYLGFDTERGIAYGVTCWSSKLWDPESKRYVYANPDFCMDDTTLNDEQVNAAKVEYVNHLINGTIEWCKAQKPDADEKEIHRFARNILRKHHRELMDDIDEVLPDQSDLREEIEKTLKWASTLTTKACFMYGRWCPGGRPLSIERQTSIAFNALQKRGLTARPEFKAIWAQLTYN